MGKGFRLVSEVMTLAIGSAIGILCFFLMGWIQRWAAVQSERGEPIRSESWLAGRAAGLDDRLPTQRERRRH